MKNRIFAVLCMLAFAVSLEAQQDKFTERLLQNRYELGVQEGRLSGNGAPVLQTAMAEAQFILIGEDHGIAQVPQFSAAVCALAGQQGFHTMAVEVGPLAASQLENWAGQSNRSASLAAFEKKFPDSIAFYNMQEELDLLSRCSRAATGGKFHVWGLDQELMGSAGLILTRILETKPGKQATAAVEALLKKDDEARAKAEKSGNPGDLFMMSAGDGDLANLATLLRGEGSPVAQHLLASLMESREIYRKNLTGAGFDSNRQRALLMKSNFVRDYDTATRAEGKPPKVLMKFGGAHLFKGFNLYRNNDIGNFVAELADGAGTTSVHIMIVALKGSELGFAGIGRPYQARPIAAADEDLGPYKPLFDNIGPSGWTLFDLRGLRKGFRSLGSREVELERIVFGFDFMVVIPEGTASHQIQ